jgi:type I restriction enzyme S subunit
VIVRLKDIGRWYSGGTPPREIESFWQGHIPWVSSKDLDGRLVIDDAGQHVSEDALSFTRVAPAGSILLAVRGMALANRLPLAILSVPAAFNQDLRAVVPSRFVRSRYLAYALLAASAEILALAETAAHGTKKLETDDLMNRRVSIPPVAVQDAVVGFLDRETARIDSLADSVAEVRVLARTSFASVLAEVLGGSPAPLWFVTDPRRPVMYGIVLPGPDVSPEGVPIVKGWNVHRPALSVGDLARTTLTIEKPYARSRLRSGDLLVSIRGSFGEVEIVPKELAGSNITQDVARVSPLSSTDARWLRYCLIAPASQTQMALVATGATIRGLNIGDLKRITIPYVEPVAQARLADLLEQRERRTHTVETQTKRLGALLAEYRQALICETILNGLPDERGTPRDPDEGLVQAAEAALG